MNVSLSILKQASTALGSIPSLLLYLSSHSLIARVPLLVAIVSLALFLFFGVSWVLPSHLLSLLVIIQMKLLEQLEPISVGILLTSKK